MARRHRQNPEQNPRSRGPGRRLRRSPAAAQGISRPARERHEVSPMRSPELVPHVDLADLPGWRGVLLRCENLLLVVPLTAMVLLPVTEIVLRHVLHTGISGSS